MRPGRIVRFAFPVWHESQIGQGALLARSIASLGGTYAVAPVAAFVESSLAVDVSLLKGAGCTVERFRIPDELLRVPFAAKCAGAAAAEESSESSGMEGTLVWMDPDSLVLAEPSELAMAPGIDIALRPVDHANIGSRADAPLDGFWRPLYGARGLAEGAEWRVEGTVDGSRLRGYFNAGLLAAWPEACILRGWLTSLLEVSRAPWLGAALGGDDRRPVFLHQAVLACEVMARVPRERAVILPETYNFPAHMSSDHPLSRKPDVQVVTCRYGDAEGSGRVRSMRVGPEARRWLDSAFPD